MNDRTAGAILLVIGVVAIFAAIVGGGIKIQQIEVGSVQSKWRQWLLAAFGLVIGAIGLTMVLPDSDTANNVADTENAASADENASNANGVDENAVDENAAEPAADENTASDNGTAEAQ
jgi:hypothetical protein